MHRLFDYCNLEGCTELHHNNHEAKYMQGPVPFQFCTTEHMLAHIKTRLDHVNRVCVEVHSVSQPLSLLVEA